MDARAGACLGALWAGHADARYARRSTQTAKIADWTYDLWSNTHSTRPGAGRRADRGPASLQAPFQPPAARAEHQPSGNGDRNAVPALYDPEHAGALAFPSRHAAAGLGAEGARRLRQCVRAREHDGRARADGQGRSGRIPPAPHGGSRAHAPSIEAAADGFGWSSERCRRAAARASPSRATRTWPPICAMALELEVERGDRPRARRARRRPPSTAARPSIPDGIRNQTEGGILQSASWTLYEAVTFEETGITSIDWSSYPILRFVRCRTGSTCASWTGRASLSSAPARPRKGRRPAAIGNALRQATGAALRHPVPGGGGAGGDRHISVG